MGGLGLGRTEQALRQTDKGERNEGIGLEMGTQARVAPRCTAAHAAGGRGVAVMHGLPHAGGLAPCFDKLGPVLWPISAKLLASDLALGFALDQNRNVRGASLVAIAHIAQVAQGCSAPLREFLSRLIGAKALEK